MALRSGDGARRPNAASERADRSHHDIGLLDERIVASIFHDQQAGLLKRRTASHAIAPTETRRKIALNNAARIDVPRSP